MNTLIHATISSWHVTVPQPILGLPTSSASAGRGRRGSQDFRDSAEGLAAVLAVSGLVPGSPLLT